MNRRFPRALRAAAIGAALAAVPACHDKTTEVKRESTGDAGAPKQAGVDKNLAEAVAAAAGDPTGGPPQTGIMTTEAADKEIKVGDPAKFSLGGKGDGTMVTFGPNAFKSGKQLIAQTEVSVRTGPQSAIPTIVLTLAVERDKSDAPEGVGGLPSVTAKVTGAKLAKTQPGQIPPEMEAEIGKIKGSKLHLELSPAGGARVTGIEVSTKDGEESYGLVLLEAANSVALAYLPYPAEPVGVGAYWLVTTREAFMGLDVIAYRMIKLEKLEADNKGAGLSVNTKRFVAGGTLALPGLPAHKLQEFTGTTQGQLVVAVAEPAAAQGLLQDAIGAGILVKDGPPGRDRLGLQLQARTQLVVQTK